MSRWESTTDVQFRVRDGFLWKAVLVLGVISLLAVFIGLWAADRGSSQEARTATPVAATVTAIHVRDDIVNWSIIDVQLATDPPRTLAIRTQDELTYQLNKKVTVLLDARHPAQSAIEGDPNGPTWTLGTVYLGASVAFFAGLAVLVLLAVRVTASRRLRRLRREPLPPPRRSEIAAAIAGLPAAAFPHAPTDELADVIRTRERRRRWLLLGPTALAGAIALGGLAVHLLAGPGLLDVLLVLGGAYTTLYLLTIAHSLYSTRSASHMDWHCATAVLCGGQTGYSVGGSFLIVEDRDHAGVYRTLVQVPGPGSVRLREGPCWIAHSRAAGQIYVFPVDSRGVLSAHLWAAWQQDKTLHFAAHDAAAQVPSRPASASSTR